MSGIICTAIFFSLEIALLFLGGSLLFAYLLRCPYHGTLLSVLLSGFGTVSLYHFGALHIKAYQIVLLTILLVLLIYNILGKKKLFLPSSYAYVLPLFVLALLLSMINAPYPAVLIKQFFLLFIYLIMMIVVTDTVDTIYKLERMVRVIAFSAFIACLYSLLIILKVVPSNIKTVYHFARPQSFFAEPNEFGVFLVFTAGYVLALLIAKSKVLNRIWLWAILAMILANIIPNMSRGSWVGMLVSAGVIVYFAKVKGFLKLNILKIAFATIAVIVVIIGLLNIMSLLIPTKYKANVEQIVSERAQSLFSRKDPTRDIRYRSNKAAIEAFLEHPFIGQGLGNSFVVWERKYANKESDFLEIPPLVAATSSNFISDLAVETGLFGIGSFLVLVWVILRRGHQVINCARNEHVVIIMIGAYASFVGMLVNGLTYATVMLPYLWISAGILSCYRQEFY